MSDTTSTDAPVEETTPQETPAAAPVPAPAVTAQESKVVGDDDLEVREPDTQVTQEQVAAQVAQPREADRDTVDVHEVHVTTDTVITDPSSPLAVQIPEAGRSPLHKDGLPIAQLDAERVEDVFTREASGDKS